ncbi:hypothetical protein Tco_0961844 [Tanacetum coccineum]
MTEPIICPCLLVSYETKEDTRSTLAGVFSPNIDRPLHGVKLLGRPASVHFDFNSELMMKRVARTIVLMDTIAKINDPQCELLLLHACAAFGPTFDVALCVFNTKMKNDLLSNPTEIAAPKLKKKLAYIYFTRITQTTESTYSLSPRHMSLWKYQMEDHTSDWLRVVLISGLGHTMNETILYRMPDFASKEVNIGFGGGCDKPLCQADMLLYSWDAGLDVCVDLVGSSPLT